MEQPPADRIMALVHSCSGMNTEARGLFLDAECNGDARLRKEVELLLDEAGEKTDFQAIPDRFEYGLPEHYHLIRQLGSGGMAEIFLAEDTRLGRHVAIKFLNETFRHDADLMRRFDQEARAASALNHPNILTIYDIGEAEGVRYIVTEYIDGESLGMRLARGRLSLRESLDVACQVASALNAAHKAGIVHRDLKPDNIMLRPDGSPKVLDFGLAKAGATAFSGADAAGVSTSPGMVLGTPAYMSPEQTRGAPLDGRTDIFSHGIVLFEMLTGRRPFGSGTPADMIASIIREEPKPILKFIPDAPELLVRIVDRSLQKDRGDRYSSMAELLSDLDDLRSELAWSSRHLDGDGRTDRVAARDTIREPTSRGRYYVAAAATGLVLLGVSGWFLITRGWGSTPAAIPMRSVPITSWSSVSAEAISAASFSPNSEMIAFGSRRTGSPAIWVKQTTGGEAREIIKNGFENQYPIWSPDGQEIAYLSIRGANRGIWRSRFMGGAETQIVTGASPPSPMPRPIRWATDGRLYFQDGVDLHYVDITSGERKQLTDLGSADIRPRTIAVSHDGKLFGLSFREDNVWKVKIRRSDAVSFAEVASSKEPIDSVVFDPTDGSVLYTTAVEGGMQIFRALPGRVPVRISSGITDLSLLDVSKDGGKILYSSVKEESDVWSVAIQDARESVVVNDVAAEYWADISPDGKSVAYQSVSRPDKPFRGSIYVTSQSSAGTPTLISQDGYAPVWSPDGQWIAFLRQNDGVTKVWKARPTGTDAAAVADGGGLGYVSAPYLMTETNHLSWSPDSASIAYSSISNLVSNLWITSADGLSRHQITKNIGPGETYCCVMWSDDGIQIAYSSEVPNSHRRLWLARPNGDDVKVIFQSDAKFRSLGFSSNQQEILIAQRPDPADTSPTPATTSIFAISIATGVARKVNSLSNAYFHNIHLSKDGHTLAFVSKSDDRPELWIVPALGGTPKKLLSEKDPKVMISSLAWSADGSSIVFGKQTRTNMLSMLTN